MKEWDFFTYRPNQKQRDSSSDKHFKGLELNDSLVRELTQNSLDAVFDGDQPVRISVSPKEIPSSDVKKYLVGLNPHLKACGLPAATSSGVVKFLVIEDFNTTGLAGDKKKSFFVQDNIRTDDRAHSGGSHGIGKIVFNLASKIKTFFAYSVYDSGDCFEGSCGLKSHKLDGRDYTEDGRLILDVATDKTLIGKLFARKRNETGLSIAIPLVSGKIKLNTMRECFVDEYYLPIIRGKLVVRIDGQCITADTILSANKPKAKLISEYETGGGAVSESIGTGYISSGSDDFRLDNIDHIAARLQDKKPVFIKFAIGIKSVKDELVGNAVLLIAANENGEEERFDFWRENLLVANASQYKSRSKEYTAILLVEGEDNELSTLLRKLENPSHTRWEYEQLPDDVKVSYVRPLVRYLTQLPNKVIRLIKLKNVKLDNTFFCDYFSVEGEDSPQPPPPPPPPHTSSRFVCTSVNGGFAVSRKGNSEGINITIMAAYATNSGNPFSNYAIEDFDFNPDADSISIDIRGGSCVSKNANQLVCLIDSENFKATLTGFDSDRELKVDIR